MEACLKEVRRRTLQADVNVQYVVRMKKNIVKAVNIQEPAAGLNARKLLEKAVFTELCNMLEAPGVGANVPDAKGREAPFRRSGCEPQVRPEEGPAQRGDVRRHSGCGKTTTCAKFAHYYAKKGFKPALVCADTFRAGAFDQLKQNATKARIPFYGSYTETDPAKIAAQGVEGGSRRRRTISSSSTPPGGTNRRTRCSRRCARSPSPSPRT